MRFISQALIVAALIFGGCAHTPPVINNVLSDIVDCGKKEVQQIATQIIPEVTTIVSSYGDDWRSQVTEFGKTHGEDALACVIQELKSQSTFSATGNPTDPVNKKILDRSTEYITFRGYKFKPLN